MPGDMCKEAAPEAEGLISSERFADDCFCRESSSIKYGSMCIIGRMSEESSGFGAARTVPFPAKRIDQV
jgi:hypothetical protein